MATAAPRRTQHERSEQTRAKLLGATIDCLVEYGYGATSTRRIADRAGVSRGAQLHHFPDKARLVASAVEHLAECRLADMARQAPSLPAGRARLEAALDLLWGAYTGPLYEAALELWIAARTDPALRAELDRAERRTGAAIRDRLREVVGPEIAAGPAFTAWLPIALSTMRGLALVVAALALEDRDERWARTRPQLAAVLLEGTAAG